MSIKRFCDMCGAGIERSYVSPRLTSSLKNWVVEVQVQLNGTWNRGDLCKSCVLRIINEGTQN